MRFPGGYRSSSQGGASYSGENTTIVNSSTITAVHILLYLVTIYLPLVTSASIAGIIKNDPNLSLFADALEKAERMDGMLDGSDGEVYTVFAPDNSALETDDTFQVYVNNNLSWRQHLQESVDIHIVEGLYTRDEIFDGERIVLNSYAGDPINITQSFNLVQGQEVVTNAEVIADNGIVYMTEGVLPNPFQSFNFYTSMEEQVQLNPELRDLIGEVNFQEQLTELKPLSGTTWVAWQTGAFSDNPILADDLRDSARVNGTYDTLLYNLIDSNIYQEDFQRSSHVLVFPRNRVAHMWISMSADLRTFRFNDAKVVRNYMASNGPVYVVDEIVTPPGLIESIGFCGRYTEIDTKETYQFLISTLWDTRNLSNSVGGGYNTGGYNYSAVLNPLQYSSYENYTMFVPVSNAYLVNNREDMFRPLVATPIWIRHLRNFMGHFLIQPAMYYDDLVDYVNTFPSRTVSLQMVSGFNTTLMLDGNDRLHIDNAEFVELKDLKAVDGLAHYISEVPLPPSFAYSTYEQIQQNGQLSTLKTLIDTVFMGLFIDNQSPLTFFVAPNHVWDVNIPIQQLDYVLRSHAFRGILFTDILKRDYNGRNITDIEQKNWTVDIFDDTIYIDYHNPFTNSVIVEGEHSSNVLTRTGVIHYVDRVFLKQAYPSNSPPPTFAPTPQMNVGGGILPPGSTGISGAPTIAPEPSTNTDDGESSDLDSNHTSSGFEQHQQTHNNSDSGPYNHCTYRYTGKITCTNGSCGLEQGSNCDTLEFPGDAVFTDGDVAYVKINGELELTPTSTCFAFCTGCVGEILASLCGLDAPALMFSTNSNASQDYFPNKTGSEQYTDPFSHASNTSGTFQTTHGNHTGSDDDLYFPTSSSSSSGINYTESTSNNSSNIFEHQQQPHSDTGKNNNSDDGPYFPNSISSSGSDNSETNSAIGSSTNSGFEQHRQPQSDAVNIISDGPHNTSTLHKYTGTITCTDGVCGLEQGSNCDALQFPGEAHFTDGDLSFVHINGEFRLGPTSTCFALCTGCVGEIIAAEGSSSFISSSDSISSTSSSNDSNSGSSNASSSIHNQLGNIILSTSLLAMLILKFT